MGPKTERRQQHGEQSRQRILDATVEIAAERGYEGTSIALVSERSGLPRSSIYWHFRDKDDLLAAVIERSYHLWRERLLKAASTRTPGLDRAARLREAFAAVASSLLDQPEFLRLGMMLTLEHRPVEAKARQLFVDIRAEVLDFALNEFQPMITGTSDAERQAGARRLAAFTLAASDGLFMAYQLAPDTFDLHGQFDMLALTIDAAWDRLTA
ncbi:TetR/AcrR family transcriptional regulator [Actinomadura bangladeshensis]|uniref:TetR/AcrR family transcriptional regulator n=1 Tax=Actinomadura bangladeshensis TaxID=453573 RepID=A0A6L9Q8G4_9ACTN|nr:TetR/AcrR family transcriptional regulator [Actinomadura bangladeshensis]NEA21717.1 TetR/AcrR family transcriptional regulator [Actinomadura bangladeshensis]